MALSAGTRGVPVVQPASVRLVFVTSGRQPSGDRQQRSTGDYLLSVV
jgi:hypothetical protein